MVHFVIRACDGRSAKETPEAGQARTAEEGQERIACGKFWQAS